MPGTALHQTLLLFKEQASPRVLEHYVGNMLCAAFHKSPQYNVFYPPVSLEGVT